MEKEELLKELGFTPYEGTRLWRNGSMCFYIDISNCKDNESITRAIFFAGENSKSNKIKQELGIII